MGNLKAGTGDDMFYFIDVHGIVCAHTVNQFHDDPISSRLFATGSTLLITSFYHIKPGSSSQFSPKAKEAILSDKG
jgi:hypothetical protein